MQKVVLFAKEKKITPGGPGNIFSKWLIKKTRCFSVCSSWRLWLLGVGEVGMGGGDEMEQGLRHCGSSFSILIATTKFTI